MKKLVALVGIAAAVYGAKKLFTGKGEQAGEHYVATEYGSTGFAAPQQD